MSMLTQARRAARAMLRPLKQPLFDTGILAAAANNRVQFFATAQGAALGAGNKTEVDTNLQQQGQIGRPLEFDLYGFNVELVNDIADVPNNVVDRGLVYTSGVFQFFFGQQRPWLEVPFTQIPNGPYVTGTIATADATTPTNYASMYNGKSSTKEFYDFTIGKEPVPIASAETFSALLSFPTAAVTLNTATRVRCYMKGILFASL